MLNTRIIGAVSTPPTFVEDVFNTWAYTLESQNTSYAIQNNIDLSGKGGLVWFKPRSQPSSGDGHNYLFDTARGSSPSNIRRLSTNSTAAQDTGAGDSVQFNSNGFTSVYSDGGSNLFRTTNNLGGIYYQTAWTFRKQAKFFDIVTYTGNGAGNRTISHSLGSSPGMIVCRSFTGASSWWVYHRSLASKNMLFLNLTSQAADYSPDTMVGNPTSTTFDVNSSLNSSGETYVAYLFAHNAGGFGTAGTDNIISCGTFTGGDTVNLGYEPQFLMWKRTDGTSDWRIHDTMRGFTNGSSPDSGAYSRPEATLAANTSAAETSSDFHDLLPTGFKHLGSGGTYIYMAIRRPNKPPTSGTSVYNTVSETPWTGNSGSWTPGFVTDMMLKLQQGGISNHDISARLTGNAVMYTDAVNEESRNNNSEVIWDFMSGVGRRSNTTSTDKRALFRRAPGFFDVVCFNGSSGAGTLTHNHGLGVTPELILAKYRDRNASWYVYAAPLGATKYLELNTTDAVSTSSGTWNNTAPTSTTFTTGNFFQNGTPNAAIAYLFASVAGVSKVGSYTGNGSSQTIDCGFTAGARFVLIKRTDSTGDWVVVDTARGIVSGNDPFLQLNSTAAEITNEDIVDPANSGFIVNTTTENINANGGTYIFLAIA